MADLTSRLIVRLIDGVSGPAAKAAVGLRRLMGASEKQAMAGRGTMLAAQRDMALIGRGAQRVSTSMSMPMALIGAMGARTVYEYEKVGNALEAVTMMTKEQREEIEKEARVLNKDFPAALDQIMGAAFELGRAGLKFDEIMGALRGTLQLGLAGDLGLPQAADIATNILTAMRLPAQGAEEVAASLKRVNDVVSFVATNSNTDVGLMGETLKYVAPIAAAAGVSLEELGAASMVLAKGGIRGSEAGVALRSALVRMVKPSLDARQAMAELGMSFEDFATSYRALDVSELASGMKNIGFDISKVLGKIKGNISGMSLETDRSAIHEEITSTIIKGLKVKRQTDQEKIAKAVSKYVSSHIEGVDMIGMFDALVEKGVSPGYMSRIFDQRQGARLTNMIREVKPGLSELSEALAELKEKAEGATAWMAERRMDGIVGQVNRLTSAFVELNIAIAESGVLETVGETFDKIAGSLSNLSKTSPLLLKIGTYGAMAAVALIPLGMALTGLAGVAKIVFGILGAIGSGIALIGAIPAAIIAGVLLAGAAIWYFWDEIKEAGSAIGDAISKWATESVEALGRMVDYFANLGSEIGSAIRETSADLSNAGAELLQSLWEGMKSKFSAMVSWASGIPSRIGGAIKGALGFGGGSGGSENLPARSRGGHVSRGRSYLVGERRPEIFTPGSSGYIHSRVPDGGRPQTITVAPVINVNGASDPVTIAEMVKREITRAIRDGLRGIHADAGAAVW